MDFELKKKLETFGVARTKGLFNTKSSLMHEADEAYFDGDKERCMDAISQLYDLFDEDLA